MHVDALRSLVNPDSKLMNTSSFILKRCFLYYKQDPRMTKGDGGLLLLRAKLMKTKCIFRAAPEARRLPRRSWVPRPGPALIFGLPRSGPWEMTNAWMLIGFATPTPGCWHRHPMVPCVLLPMRSRATTRISATGRDCWLLVSALGRGTWRGSACSLLDATLQHRR